MQRFFLLNLYSTGRPVPTCLQTLGSYVPCSASSTHSFNKRRGETVHFKERRRFAVARRPHLLGMPLEDLRGPVQLMLTRTFVSAATFGLKSR